MELLIAINDTVFSCTIKLPFDCLVLRHRNNTTASAISAMNNNAANVAATTTIVSYLSSWPNSGFEYAKEKKQKCDISKYDTRDKLNRMFILFAYIT